MEKIKIGSLKDLDEKKFKKIKENRADWLSKGKDIHILLDEKTRNFSDIEMKDFFNLVLKKIVEENNNHKTLIFRSVYGEPLSSFKAGQKISITIPIDDVYYTRPYSLSSTSALAKDGEYHITIKDDEDVLNNYLFNKLKVDEKVIASKPFGDFYYDGIRDEKNVIAIASDEGIIPIYAMIQDIITGVEDFNLTLFYSAKYFKDFLFYDELKDYSDKSKKIKVIFCLSVEHHDGCLDGFTSIDKIRNEMGEINSFLISGGEGLLKYLDKELEELKLPRKLIHYDDYLPKCNIKKVVAYKLYVYVNDEIYEATCYNNKTIMTAIEEAGIYIPSRCRNGSCGFCNSELVSGKVKIVNDKRPEAMKKYNYIHPCAAYPLSDIEIVIR